MAVLALIGAACGVGSGPGGTPKPTSTTAPPDPDRVILRVDDEGGFAPAAFALNRVPRFVLFADGRLVFPGPQPAIFPGPLLPSLQTVTLSSDQMRQVLDLVDAIGLPRIDREIDDSNNRFVADATTTTVTWFDDAGRAHTYGAYALGLVDDRRAEAREQTRLLSELLTTLDEFASTGDPADPYLPERIQLRLEDASALDPEFKDAREWPLALSPDDFEPAAFGLGCTTFAGRAASDALASLEDATDTTVWTYAGREYQILVRPLFPGEPGCTP